MNKYIRKLKTLIILVKARIFGVISILLRPFISIDNQSILFWSWRSSQYSCNPKSISDFLESSHHGEFKLYWSFKGQFPNNLGKDVIPLKWGSWEYLITAIRCKFLISNTRNDLNSMMFFKRREQIYIMTWHAGMSLKKIEKDAVQSLPKESIKMGKNDSKMCDLMISGSAFQTNLLNNSFWYSGEVLNSGSPRNDILFCKNLSIRQPICKKYSVDENLMIILYAPTFRSKFNAEVVSFDWNSVKNAVQRRFNRKPILFVRLHPNISEMTTELDFDFSESDICDVTTYPDMQELLLGTDILITDYSSSMFDFTLTGKPCFILAKDKMEYNRGFYISLDALPFSISTTNSDLEKSILNFDEDKYLQKIASFNRKTIGAFDDGLACRRLYNWMKNKI